MGWTGNRGKRKGRGKGKRKRRGRKERLEVGVTGER